MRNGNAAAKSVKRQHPSRTQQHPKLPHATLHRSLVFAKFLIATKISAEFPIVSLSHTHAHAHLHKCVKN